MKRNNMMKSAFKIMKQYKLRTFFMMLGMIIGITALTLVFSIGEGTQRKLKNKVEKLFSSSDILINAGPGELRGGPEMGAPTTTLTINDIREIKEQIPNIKNFDTVQLTDGRSVKYKDKSVDLRIMGNSHRAEHVWNRSVSSGSYFTEEDMMQSARVALVGTEVVKTLFKDIHPVGEQIRIGNVPFRVLGVLEPMGIDPHGLDRDNEIIIPITTLMRRVMNIDYIVFSKLQLKDVSKMAQTVAEVKQILRDRHHISSNDPDDFVVITPVMIQKILNEMTRTFSIFLPLIAGIALLVGGVVIAALMLIMVNERTCEIGLRKALGARSKDILRQILFETMIIAICGGLVGLILGFLGVQLVLSKMNLPNFFPWTAFILGFIFSAITGFLAGFFPARKAAKLNPIEIL